MTDHIANYEKIIAEKMIYGKELPQIAKENGLSYTYTYSAYAMFNAVKEEDWDRLVKLIEGANMPYSRIEWAAGRLGKEVPPFLKQAYEDRMARNREKQRAKYAQKKEPYPDMLGWVSPETEEEPEPQSDPEPQQAPAEVPPEVIVEKKLDNTALCMCKILTALAEQNELLEQLLDVVFPKYIGDIKDNINANFDILTGEVKACADKLEGIKINTRKRGL